MTKKIKARFIILFLILIIVISGCMKKDDKRDMDIITGTDGLEIEFFENYPKDRYVVSDQWEQISVIVNIRNKGAFPSGGKNLENGNVYLSGFDENIIDINPRSKSLDELYLPPVSSFDPNGGFDSVEFDGKINGDNLKVDRHDSVILATICYPYRTKIGTSVCVNPHSFDTPQGDVCEIGGHILTSQGAPIAITRIDEEASTNKILFKISIKNVGGGDVIKIDALGKCDPSRSETLERDDFDKIRIENVKVGSEDILDSCEPFVEDGSNTIKLYDGGGFIICSLDVSGLRGINSAYTAPLNVELSYGYISTISKQVEIVKFTSIG